MSAWELESIQDAQRRLRCGNREEVRALAKAWGLPQKVAGKNRSVPDMRRDLEEKIATALAEKTAQSEPLAAQGEKPLAEQGHAMVLALVGAAQGEGKEEEESDARALELKMGQGLAGESGEAMALAEPVADQGDDGVARKVARTAPGNVLEFLDHAEVRKASADLETLPADARVDELRNLLELWRNVREQTSGPRRRDYLRQVARSFKITLSLKETSSPYLMSKKISEAFVQRVSALRPWESMRDQGSSSSASATPAFPAPPHGRDGDVAKLATESLQRPTEAPVMAQRRKDKRKAEDGAGGDLKRFMVTKSSDLALDPADHGREKCQRIEDISTIEDAWDVVRGSKEIPTELKKRVGQVRGLVSRKEILPLQKTYGIRTAYKTGKQLIEESFQWQRYEI